MCTHSALRSALSLSTSTSSSPMASSTAQQSMEYVCLCLKHNFGHPHSVSKATWYCHIEEAKTEEEKQRLRASRADRPSVHTTHTATIQAMVKRWLETVKGAHHHVGHHKCAHIQNIVSRFHSVYCDTNLEIMVSIVGTARNT